MRGSEVLATAVMVFLLAVVVVTWPRDRDLGSWCGFITRCVAQTVPVAFPDRWQVPQGNDALQVELERLRRDNAVLMKGWQGWKVEVR